MLVRFAQRQTAYQQRRKREKRQLVEPRFYLKKYAYYIFIFGFFYTSATSQILVGKNIKELKGFVLTDSTIDLLTEPAQTNLVRIAYLDSICMEVLLNEKNVIDFISTGDNNFKTREGLAIGDTFKKMSKCCHVKEKNVIKLPGWGYYIKLTSGWNAVFDFSKPITPSSEILFFFQKN